MEGQIAHVASDGAVDGIGGIEIELTQGDQGDPEIGLGGRDVASFFYEPTSYKDDFQRCRDTRASANGWIRTVAKQMWPDAPDDAFSGLTLSWSTTRIVKSAGSPRQAPASDAASLTSGTSTTAAGATRSSAATHLAGGQVLSQGREGQGLLQVHHVLGERRSGRRPLRLHPQHEVSPGRVERETGQAATYHRIEAAYPEPRRRG
jgi:hypothetical protein